MKRKPGVTKYCFRCGSKSRQVKTYGSMDWCRSCVQDLIALGVKMPEPTK